MVVADTGPINYLVLIGAVDIVPQLFAGVVLPSAVKAELSHPFALPAVKEWIAAPPAWLEIVDTPNVIPFPGLHVGESAAISLA